MYYFKVLILGFVLFHLTVQEPIVCPIDSIYQLKEGDYIQFESPNFPQSLVNGAENHKKDCKGNFTRTDGKTGLWFVILNGQLETFAIDDGNKDTKVFDYYYSNKNWLTFYSNLTDLNFYFTSNYASLEWIAFQAFVYAKDSSISSLCHLSNSSTIAFKDEKSIIPITSDIFYTPINWPIRPIRITCDWNFNVPAGFGLKITLISFNRRYSILKVLPNDVDLTIPGVYYFNGTNFNIRYIQEDSDAPGTGFAALITAVKFEQPKNGTCKLNTENGINSWSNMDTVNGYNNLQTCTYPISIDTSQELQLKVNKLLEQDADKLALKLSNGTLIDIENGNWIIDSSFTVSNLKFESDGSIVQAGFEIQMQLPDCSCNSTSIIIECDVLGKVIFNPGFAGYCRNMNCTYTVSSFHKCPNNGLLLSFDISLRSGSSDTLKVYANSTLIKIFDASEIDSPIFDIHFDPSTNITFNFYSDSKLYGFYKAGQIIIKAYSFVYSPGPIFNLNATNFAESFLIDSIKEFSSLTIHGAAVDDYLDLFVAPQLDNTDESYANLDSIRVYDGSGIGNFVTTLDKLRKNAKDYVPRSIVSQSGSLTLLRLSDDPIFSTAFFRLRKEHTSGCTNAENVYSSEGTNLTASAGPFSTCMVTVLSTATVPFSPTNVLTFLNPTINANKSFGVIAETDTNFPYFYFNSQTASLWNSVFLFGIAFSFLIPANLTLDFSYRYTYAQGPVFDTLPAKGVFSSSNYADDQAELPLPNVTFTIPSNFVMNLEVKYFDFSNSSNCYIKQNGQQIQITKAGQTLFINSGFVNVIFNEKEKGHRGVLFVFEVVIASTSITTSEMTTSLTTSIPPSTTLTRSTSISPTKTQQTTLSSSRTSSTLISQTTTASTLFSTPSFSTTKSSTPTSTTASTISVVGTTFTDTTKEITTTTFSSTLISSTNTESSSSLHVYAEITMYILLAVFIY